jgi:hypothetical protein
VLDDGNEDYIIELNETSTVSGLGTMKLHEILVDIAEEQSLSE